MSDGRWFWRLSGGLGLAIWPAWVQAQSGPGGIDWDSGSSRQGGIRMEQVQADDRFKGWAVATLKEELGFRMAELTALQEALEAEEGSRRKDTAGSRRQRLALQRNIMESYWAVNRLKRELMVLAPGEISADRPEPEAVVPPQLRPLLGTGAASQFAQVLPKVKFRFAARGAHHSGVSSDRGGTRRTEKALPVRPRRPRNN